MKKDKLYFVTLTPNYLAYLAKFENKVSTKLNRPFIGIVLKIENKEYFAPLSSPKEKHKKLKNNLDLIKIKNGELGVINLNNMVPVINSSKVKIPIDLEILSKSLNPDDKKYFRLLKKQLEFCEMNKEKILYQSKKIHTIFSKDFENLSNTQKLMYGRVNNFKVLEYASKEFEEKYITKSSEIEKNNNERFEDEKNPVEEILEKMKTGEEIDFDKYISNDLEIEIEEKNNFEKEDKNFSRDKN